MRPFLKNPFLNSHFSRVSFPFISKYVLDLTRVFAGRAYARCFLLLFSFFFRNPDGVVNGNYRSSLAGEDRRVPKCPTCVKETRQRAPTRRDARGAVAPLADIYRQRFTNFFPFQFSKCVSEKCIFAKADPLLWEPVRGSPRDEGARSSAAVERRRASHVSTSRDSRTQRTVSWRLSLFFRTQV